MISFLPVLIIVMGTWGMTEWLRHDHRIQDWLVRVETTDSPRWSFIRAVLSCGFCLSHWTAGLCLVLWFLVPFGKFLVLYFAVIRLANLCNDLTHKYSRSPERTKLDGINEPDESNKSDNQ